MPSREYEPNMKNNVTDDVKQCPIGRPNPNFYYFTLVLCISIAIPYVPFFLFSSSQQLPTRSSWLPCAISHFRQESNLQCLMYSTNLLTGDFGNPSEKIRFKYFKEQLMRELTAQLLVSDYCSNPGSATF